MRESKARIANRDEAIMAKWAEHRLSAKQIALLMNVPLWQVWRALQRARSAGDQRANKRPPGRWISDNPSPSTRTRRQRIEQQLKEG